MNMLFFTAFVAIIAVTNGMLVQPRQELEKQKSMDVEIEASPLCAVCKLVVNKAVELLKDGDTEAEIEKIVKNVCKILPGHVETECKNLVDKYGDQIIQMITNSVDPQLICGLLTLCSTDSTQAGKEVEKQKPSHVVQNISPCLLCERVVDEGQKLLAKGATKAEIEKGMRKACDELIGQVVKEECNKLLDEYENKIIPLLTESVKAVKLCGTFKLC